MGLFFRLLGFLIVLGLALAAGGIYFFLQRLDGPGPAAADTTVVIPRGSGVRTIARILQDSGVIAEPLVFDIGVRLYSDGQPLRAGEYRFPAAVSTRQAMQLMLEGRTVVRRLTIAEGLTTAEILALVAAAEGLDGDMPPPAALPGEGVLLPETYHYSLGDDRAELLQRMANAMQTTLAELWAKRAPDLPVETPDGAVVLASIVEKETGVPAERPRVAAVFVNRLRLGMPLQSDPTVIYALTEGKGPLDRPLTRADLAVKNTYNTYVNAGLPPGPIANPGRAALEAVLQPIASKELYFVADGTGGHVFAETLAEHNRNVANWRKIQAAQPAAGDASDDKPAAE